MSEDPTPLDAEEAPRLTEQMSDEDIMAAIQAQTAANRAAAAAAGPRPISLQDLYFQMTALVKTEARLPGRGKLTEQSAVKLLELALMWALNTRNNPTGVLNDEIPTEEIGNSGEGITPDEEIGPADDQETAA